MALPDSDASVGHSFGLEVDGVFTSRLSEVSGLKMEREIVEFREGGADGAGSVRLVPGRWKTPELTLTRGLTTDTNFEKWVKDSQSGQGDAVIKSGSVSVLDFEGGLVKKYVFTKAWPKSLEVVTSGDADGARVVSERLVLACERIEPA